MIKYPEGGHLGHNQIQLHAKALIGDRQIQGDRKYSLDLFGWEMGKRVLGEFSKKHISASNPRPQFLSGKQKTKS